MNGKNLDFQIRSAVSNDIAAIERIYLNAFDETEAALVSSLALDLLQEKDVLDSICLVALSENNIVGHVAFSPVFIKNAQQYFAYILAPLAVSPEYQKNHVGTALVRRGVTLISQTRASVVFVYGDPDYYSRFGFKLDLAKQFIPPYPLTYPEGWLALGINPFNLQDATKIRCVRALNNEVLW